MDKLSQRLSELGIKNKLIGIVVIDILLMALVLGLFIMPLHEQNRLKEQELLAFNKQLTELQAYDLSETQFAELLLEKREAAETAEDILPDRVDAFWEIEALSKLAQDCNMSITGLKVAKSSGIKAGYQQHSFECTVVGDYFDLLKLLTSIYNRLQITDLDIASVNTGLNGKLSVNMNIKVYSLH